MLRLLSGTYLFNTPTGTPAVAFDVLTGLFGLLLIVSLLVYWRRSKLAGENPPKRHLIRSLASTGIWTSIVGLFLALMRYIEFPYLSMPVLMLALIFLMVLLVGYYVYVRVERYPGQVWEFDHKQWARQYRPTPKRENKPQPVRDTNRPRGKQRRTARR